ncbi:MAG: hypothetical protein KAS87_06125 [Candidatus Omnitrophica bacterium]|nr:hypothetical protein [Candidatus Omnitrophota bacterium]
MSSGSRKKHRKTSSYGVFKKGSGIKEMNISRKFDVDLVEQKKDEIINLVRNLKGESLRITQNSKRALCFEIGIAEKSIKLQFIFWTDKKSKPENQIKSNSATFFLRVVHEDVREKILDYLEGIKRGLTTEYLGIAVLERLERVPLQERKFKYFRKAKPWEDKKEGKDVIVVTVKDGRDIEIPIQFKSSEEKLRRHKERFPNVPGWFRVFMGNREEEMDIIEEKTVKIIEARKRGETIFI